MVSDLKSWIKTWNHLPSGQPDPYDGLLKMAWNSAIRALSTVSRWRCQEPNFGGGPHLLFHNFPRNLQQDLLNGKPEYLRTLATYLGVGWWIVLFIKLLFYDDSKMLRPLTQKTRIIHPQNRSKFCSLLPSTNNLLQNLIKTKLQ